MLAKDCVTKNVTSRTPRKTVWSAAELLKTHDIGALVVVSSISDPLLEGIITDRYLCCSAVASPKGSCAVRVGDLMTRVPVICRPEDTLEECQELMRENQMRRLSVDRWLSESVDGTRTSTKWSFCQKDKLLRRLAHLPVPLERDLNRHADRNELAVGVFGRLETPRPHFFDCREVKNRAKFLDEANLVRLSLKRHQNRQNHIAFDAAASLPDRIERNRTV